MKLKIITEPSVEPVTLAELKAQLVIDFDDDDDHLNRLIKAARIHCEKMMNWSFCTKTLEIAFDEWPDNPFRLPRPPFISLDSIKYYDTDDTEYEWDSDNYFVDEYEEPAEIALTYNGSYPTILLRPTNAIIVKYDSGFGGQADVPENIKQAILILASHWYENRVLVMKEMVIGNEIKMTVHALLGMDTVQNI